MTYTKRAVALLLALMMVFTGAVQAFAATQMTMAVIALPRSADTNKGDWGLQDAYLMGGWGTVATDSYFVYCKDSHSGPVVYCIEPGHSVRTGNILTQATDSSYWANYPGGYNPTLSPSQIKTLLGRLLQYGWRGNGNTNWNTTNASDRQDVAELIATQMLVWEVIVGERTTSFSKVNAYSKGFDAVMDNISTGNPLYEDIWEAYESIEYAVQNHILLPSFMSDMQNTASTHELVWNGSRYEITLTDTNGVLADCTLKTDSTDLQCEISGNNITFYTTNPNVSNILVVAEKEASVNNFVVWTDGDTCGGDQDVISYGQEVNETLPYQKQSSLCKSRLKKKIAHLLLTEQMNILWLTPKEMKGEMKMEITYRTEEDYRIPNLLPTQEPKFHLGKYASLRHSFLRNHGKADFINLLTTGKLNSHLAEIQRTAEKRVAEITKQMKKDLGVTEELKEKDQMKWVGLMNNIKASAEEIVMTELIQS